MYEHATNFISTRKMFLEFITLMNFFLCLRKIYFSCKNVTNQCKSYGKVTFDDLMYTQFFDRYPLSLIPKQRFTP